MVCHKKISRCRKRAVVQYYVVPAELPPDRQLMVQAPDGRPMSVVVPPELGPGAPMTLQMAAATPADMPVLPAVQIAPIKALLPMVVPQQVPAPPAEPAGPAEVQMVEKMHNQAAQHPEELALLEIAKLFDLLDIDNDQKITRNEFKKMIACLDLHRPEGAAEGWKDDAFDLFDVDKQGSIEPREFNFAMAQTLFSYRKQGRTDISALDCFKEVLGQTQKAQSAAKDQVQAVASGTKDEYVIDDKRKALAQSAEVTALHEKTKGDVWMESCGAVVCVALFPCYVCCSPFGGCCGSNALSSTNHLHGLSGAVAYITKVKETNATYFWSIQNYHYETRTRTVSDGDGKTHTETYQERVNTHYASTGGTLQCTDESDFYIPNMRKRNWCDETASAPTPCLPRFRGLPTCS